MLGEGFLAQLGVDRAVALRWAAGHDPVEAQAAYLHFCKLVGVGVPRATIQAKLERDGVQPNLVHR